MDGGTLRIDVLCTFLDAARTLTATLDGLAGQTHPGARFILVDDGSQDAGAAIAQARAAADDRFTLVSSRRHGRGHALAFALATSDAPFIAVMDADDVAHPRWLADAAALFASDPGFAVIGFERAFLFDDGRPDWSDADAAGAARPRDVTARLGRVNPIGHSGSCLRRDAIDAVGGYDLSRRTHFDYDLWIRLAGAGFRLGRSDTRRVAKRYHAGQKFAHRPGYIWSSFKLQRRAIRVASAAPAIDLARALALLGRRTARYALDKIKIRGGKP